MGAWSRVRSSFGEKKTQTWFKLWFEPSGTDQEGEGVLVLNQEETKRKKTTGKVGKKMEGKRNI